jgi:hypothetical protein
VYCEFGVFATVSGFGRCFGYKSFIFLVFLVVVVKKDLFCLLNLVLFLLSLAVWGCSDGYTIYETETTS